MNRAIRRHVPESVEEREQVSVRLTPALYAEISARAQEMGLSVNRTILQLLASGIEAEKEKKQRLAEMLRRYRESSDPAEVQKLGDELGAMIFGR